MLKFIKKFLSLLMLAFITALTPRYAFAQDNEFNFYLGASYYRATVTPQNTTVESEKLGSTFAGVLLGNYSTPLLSLDLGLGWLTTSVKGKNIEDKNYDSQAIAYAINFVETNINYRISKSWELGLASKTLIGGESSYAPTVQEQEQNKARLYGGMQILYRYDTDLLNFRTGLVGLTELTDDNRRNTWLGLSIQVAIPKFDSKKTIAQNKKTKPHRTIHTKKEVVIKTITKTEIKTETKTVFQVSPIVLYFPYNSSTLLDDDSNYLNNLSQFLTRFKPFWSNISIVGHTDTGGSIIANENTGWRRARKIEEVFLNSGIEASRITAQALSFQKLVDNRDNSLSMSRNRRVEIQIIGINHPLLAKGIDLIRKKTIVPNTYNENKSPEIILPELLKNIENDRISH